MKKLRVGVIYGGRSGEHEISVASAASVLAHLDRQRYEPVAIRIEKDGRWALADRLPTATSAAEVIAQARTAGAPRTRPGREVVLAPYPSDASLITIDHAPDAGNGEAGARVSAIGLDVIFPVLHGPFGEDGTIQGLLELAGLPYVGPGVLASAAGMDKAVMKRLFTAHGLPVTPWREVRAHEWAQAPAVVESSLRTLGLPVFVKPANLGSSVGISKVKVASALGAALDEAFAFDHKVVVEAAVPSAREIECAVLGHRAPEASVPGEVIPSREFYDYEAKYLDSGSRTVVPAELPASRADEVRRLALEAFKAVDASGMARVDFLLSTHDGSLVVNEINTIPGFTTISMFAMMWAASGVPFAVLIDRLIALALERHAERQQLRTSAV